MPPLVHLQRPGRASAGPAQPGWSTPGDTETPSASSGCSLETRSHTKWAFSKLFKCLRRRGGTKPLQLPRATHPWAPHSCSWGGALPRARWHTGCVPQRRCSCSAAWKTNSELWGTPPNYSWTILSSGTCIIKADLSKPMKTQRH